MNLEGKVAIVTGGAMGNGLGVVKTFLKEGVKVAILDYSESINETVKNLQGSVLGYKVDIRNKEEVKNIVKDIYNRYGNIDILVNNAGVCKLNDFMEMDDETRDFHFDINIKGTWNVTREVLNYMPKGSIINLSSVTGPLVADPKEVAYATTKAAILGFTKSLAAELASKNIRVNAVMPGYILTPMVQNIAKESEPENPQSVIDGIASAIPLKRMGNTDELGDLVAYLASDRSSYITGQGIVIDGGSTLPETNIVGSKNS